MALRLAQIAPSPDRTLVLAMQDDGPARVVLGASSTYDLAFEALAHNATLSETVSRHGLGEGLKREVIGRGCAEYDPSRSIVLHRQHEGPVGRGRNLGKPKRHAAQ